MSNCINIILTVAGEITDIAAMMTAVSGRMPRRGDDLDGDAEISPIEPLCFDRVIPLSPEYAKVPWRDVGAQMEVNAWGVKWGAVNFGWDGWGFTSDGDRCADREARRRLGREKWPAGAPPLPDRAAGAIIRQVGDHFVVEYRFQTSRRFPLAVFAALVKAYPGLRFYVSWGGYGPVRGRRRGWAGDVTPPRRERDDEWSEAGYNPAWEGELIVTHYPWVLSCEAEHQRAQFVAANPYPCPNCLDACRGLRVGDRFVFQCGIELPAPAGMGDLSALSAAWDIWQAPWKAGTFVSITLNLARRGLGVIAGDGAIRGDVMAAMPWCDPRNQTAVAITLAALARRPKIRRLAGEADTNCCPVALPIHAWLPRGDEAALHFGRPGRVEIHSSPLIGAEVAAVTAITGNPSTQALLSGVERWSIWAGAVLHVANREDGQDA